MVRSFLTATAIAALIGFLYWPVHAADFVWDDQVCLHTAASLRHGDSWMQFLSADFCDWRNYFRPLVVAMYAAELRIFDVAPGPMHLVSLGVHLLNTLLVGLLARALSPKSYPPLKTDVLAGTAMLLYGLHPALIEPVVWISCRFELVQTTFMLLGLLANARIERLAWRVLAVAACFFLAACTKETAAVFPLLLVLFDWIAMDPAQGKRGLLAQVQTLWQRQWPVYVAVFGAGIAYLALRHAALGFLLDTSGSVPVALSARLQTAAQGLLTYWRILVWPMFGLAPTHFVDLKQFEIFSARALGIDLAALALVLAGVYGTFKRNPFGYAILAVTVALLPVLHILPVQFDPSLYHERYLMPGLALALALLPRMVSTIPLPSARLRPVAIAGVAAAMLWLGIAVINIRVTLPLWSNETKLWQWQLAQDPQSTYAKVNLLGLTMSRGDRIGARKLADELLAETKPCSECMINIASMALEDGDLARAKVALGRFEEAVDPTTRPRILQAFVANTARLREFEHDTQGAAEAYRDAIAMDPLEPTAHMGFALFLARQGKVTEARAALDETLPLWPPDAREKCRQEFERTLAAALKSTPPAPEQHQP